MGEHETHGAEDVEVPTLEDISPMLGGREVLDLLCVRCGDRHQREVGDPYTPELCHACFDKGLRILFGDGTQDQRSRRYDRWRARWERHAVGHPTMKKLDEAMDAYYGPPSTGTDDSPF
jgi:hypothetical protein